MAESGQRIRIIPLGGVDEFGKNITVVEYGDDMLVVDCGSIFPKEDMLGVDLVIPDVTYLIKNRERIRGMLLTHGHEDHIGATPYVLRQVPMPLYGTKLTLALVDLKLKEHRIAGVPLHVIKPRDVLKLGCFTVRFLHVNHSIAGAVAIAITCPAGTIVFLGSFAGDTLDHAADPDADIAFALHDLINDQLAALQIAAQHHDGRAAGRQRAAEHAADAAIAAGDDSHAAAQVHMKRDVIRIAHG